MQFIFSFGMTCMHSCHQIRFCSCCFNDSDDDDDNEGPEEWGGVQKGFLVPAMTIIRSEV
jgi:hypothetical protein